MKVKIVFLFTRRYPSSSFLAPGTHVRLEQLLYSSESVKRGLFMLLNSGFNSIMTEDKRFKPVKQYI